MTSYELLKLVEHIQNAVTYSTAFGSGQSTRWEEVAYLKSKDELLKLAALKAEEKKPGRPKKSEETE